MSGVPLRIRLTAAFVAAGLLATGAQVFLLRDLLVSAAGDEAAIGTGLAIWLLGIGLGARVLRLASELRAGTLAGPLLALLSLWTPAGILLGRATRFLLAPPPGELPGLAHSFLLATAILAPAGFLVGALFTSLACVSAQLWPAGEGIGRLYVAESLGSLLGGGLATIAATSGVLPLRAALLGALLGTLLAGSASVSGDLGLRAPLLAALVLMLAGLGFADRLDIVSERLRFKGIAPDIQFREVLDTPYQHLVLAGDAPSYLYSGGQYSGTFPDPWSVEMLAHQVACLAPHPSRVFVLGTAATGFIRFLLQHPVNQITLVEPDTRALAFLREHLPAEDRRALDDPRVRIVAEDPRRFLTRTPASFDLIFLQSPEPVTLLGARLSTREFFRHCASRLSAEGVLVLPVRTAPAGLTGETEALAGSLFSALVDAFPVVRATPGPESLFVAGHDSNVTTLDPDILAGRWAERRLVSDVFTGELFAANFPPDRVRETEESLRAAARLFPESSDDRSLSFSHALLRRQSETASSPGSALLSLGRLPASLLAGLALLPSALALLARRRAGSRDRGVFHSVAAAGAAGMAVSLVLLFSYQTCEGALYGELGALTSLFMLGLAIGAGATRGRMSLRTSLSVVLISTAAVALSLPLLPLVSSVGFLASLSAHGGLLLLAGGATGSVFPAAATFLASGGACARDAAARMETADHVGASFAALGASVIFVPALGMRGTAWLAAGIVVLGLLAVWRLGRP